MALLRNVAFTTVEHVLDKLFGVIGIPFEYKTDYGSSFQSREFRQFAARLGFGERFRVKGLGN